MKYRILDILVCPKCKQGLVCKEYRTIRLKNNQVSKVATCQYSCHLQTGAKIGSAHIRNCKDCYTIEVVDGLLLCPCGCWYPIIGGVPRMLPHIQRHILMQRYTDFFEVYKSRLPSDFDAHSTNGATGKDRTIENFGYEWRYFSQYNAENYYKLIHPVESDFFKGKMGLDAGCGAGRHAHQAAQDGAEIFAVDISEAVDSAYMNTESSPNVHVLQADIYHLPFKKGCFDFVYSLGVIHHTPNPPKAFNMLVKLLRPNGVIFIWVYSDSRRILTFTIECIRRITIRLSNKARRLMAFWAAILDYGLIIKPYQLLGDRIGGLIEALIPSRVREYAKYNFQVSYTDWFDRISAPIVFYYNEEETRALFTRAGLDDILVTPTEDYGWRGLGRKRT